MTEKYYISNSGIGLFRKAPELYYKRYHGEGYQSKDSSASILGRALEAHVLKDEEEMPLYSLRGEDGEYHARKSVKDGVTSLSAKDAETVERMIEGLQSVPEALDLLRLDGVNQCEMEAPAGISLPSGREFVYRGRMDRFCAEASTIVEIKTSRADQGGRFTANYFGKKAWDFGYFRQAAIYKHMAEWTFGGVQKVDFAWIVFPKSEPYIPCVLRPTPGSIGQAMAEAVATIRDINWCLEKGDWRSDYRKVDKLDAPRWVK